MAEKDIKFTEKKIDEGWKEQTDREKSTFDKTNKPESTPSKTSKQFLNLLTSLGLQGMMHLG